MPSEFEHREHAEAHSLETLVSFLQTLFEALCCDSAELCSLHQKKQRTYQEHGHACCFSYSHIAHISYLLLKLGNLLLVH